MSLAKCPAEARRNPSSNSFFRGLRMSPTWRSGSVAILFSLALATGVHAQSFGFPWWRDPQFQRDLALTAEQTARIENVFQPTITKLRAKKTELDQQEEELSRLIAANADEAVVVRQVDKVEELRAHLNKTRTLMLLHMRQVLTPEQRVKLNKIHDQWEKDHQRPPRGDNDKQGRGRQ
jgi:Spy/CpxP family protein refolding chaperone